MHEIERTNGKLHLISNATARNVKQWMNTVCGKDGYLLNLTMFPRQVTCEACKKTKEFAERIPHRKYTVMICDQFESVKAVNEKDAERRVMKKIKSGDVDLTFVTWCDGESTSSEEEKCPK